MIQTFGHIFINLRFMVDNAYLYLKFKRYIYLQMSVKLDYMCWIYNIFYKLVYTL